MFLQPLSLFNRGVLLCLSWLLVSFGQPAWIWWFGLIAAAGGYALFWRVILDIVKPSTRFLVGTIWFSAVQVVQLSWATSHPYLYIYLVYAFFAVSMGMQFGIVNVFVTPKRIAQWNQLLGIAAMWTLMEWLRLFFFSGVSWNPAGLALTGAIYPVQTASIWGIFGLTFWVMLVNLLGLRAWYESFSIRYLTLWLITALIPYFYGVVQTVVHQVGMRNTESPILSAVLVQTTFPAEAINPNSSDRRLLILDTMDKWCQILELLRVHRGQQVELMVLPEYTVPCGTYSCVYPYRQVRHAFEQILGPESIAALPPLESPFAQELKSSKGSVIYVNNAFWAQGLANFFQSGILIGLEDAEDVAPNQREYYSAALYFKPGAPERSFPLAVERYEKRVLVPVGEYIPFSLCKTLAAGYGIQGSFTCGKEAKVFKTAKSRIPFGMSICYEETFGDLMRESRQKGATVLLNLTSDAWYPYSRLASQHFTHALVRAVENGMVLVRASNLGISGVVDSLGRTVAILGEDKQMPDSVQGTLRVDVPVYSYWTLYSRLGDGLIIGFCFLVIPFAFLDRFRK